MTVDGDSFVLDLLAEQRLVAIVRLDNISRAVEISQALLAGGVCMQEYTLTNPDALLAIREIRTKLAAFQNGTAAIGLGSVRNLKEADQAIECGAQFVVTPITVPTVIHRCRQALVPIMPGAYTPTEIATAWDAGASVVKVFPARNLGANFIKDVLAPMPYLRLMPTGGVDLNNMHSYFQAGAVAVGVGGNIIDAKAIANGDWNAVSDIARQYAHCARRESTP
jgi:2-dehydro-3-deoxyphosphogluconate aldolase / (4S)-4-hydroxy-2-oxoglutarate aldolase